MEKAAFRIKGMCCSEEIGVLRREVGPLVGGELNLSFDLLDRKMTVISPNGPIDERAIQERVARTGMQAEPWTEALSREQIGVEEGWWARYGRLLLCVVSGIMVVIGFTLQAIHQGGVVEALIAGEEHGGHTPLSAVIFYSLAILTGGWFIAPRAFFSARTLKPDMNLLMSVAAMGAVAIGQWLEAASVTFLFALSLLLESWSVGRARKAIRTLLAVAPTKARFVCPTDGDIEELSVEDVPVGVTVLVRPGEKIPLDGVITKGMTSINQAPITGESLPVSKQVGDEVFAGTINGDGAIEFRSTKPAFDTTLARIIRLVEEAQARRAPSEQWVEKFARTYTPLMMGLAFMIAVIPPLFFAGGWSAWFYQALVMLVIACPCALVISTPVSIVGGLTSAARNGVLIKGGAYLEAPAHIKVVAFDKTGTLTHGRPSVQGIHPMSDHTEDELLANAAALEAHSTHPLARAVLKEAEAKNIAFTPAESFTILPGQGAQGILYDRTYWVGSHRLLEEWEHESPQFHDMASRLEDAGHSLVVMWCDDHVCGLMSVADDVRPEAGATIKRLKELGIERVVMMTGDNQRTAEQMAALTGVDEYRAELLPEDKVKVVAELREKFGHVAMVGDGINDAPALAASNLAIAMGTIGTDAAIETADVALMADDLSKLPWLIEHSRRTLRIIKQNIIFALGLKALFIGLAMGEMATLWMAIMADMGASLLVISNGLRLLRINDRTATMPG